MATVWFSRLVFFSLTVFFSISLLHNLKHAEETSGIITFSFLEKKNKIVHGINYFFYLHVSQTSQSTSCVCI
jgi:hypothetical protein